MNYPAPCTETAFKDEILKLDISEDLVRAEFEIYGKVEIPLLARSELEASTSFMMTSADINIFATLFHNGELSIFLPGDTGTGNPVLLRLTCEEIQ